MEKVLGAMGIDTVKQLFEKRVDVFHVFTAHMASWLLRTSLGIQREGRDASSAQRKSYRRETTVRCLSDPAQLTRVCQELCSQLAEDLAKVGFGFGMIRGHVDCSRGGLVPFG